jgi:hypothetical protein
VIQRQKDATFQKILKEARVGALSKESCEILRDREGLNWKENKIKPTLLFPRRAEVDMINDSNLRALSGRRYSYKAKLIYDDKVPQGFSESDEGFQRVLKTFDSDAAYNVELELMVGAQVMLIANIEPDAGLVNGSRGVITSFCPSTELAIVEFVNGIRRTIGYHSWLIEDFEFVARIQVPLRLAWAVTIHKIQGATLDSALIDIGSGIFEYGQAYVALSRARSLDSLYVYDFDPISFKAHPKVKEFYGNITITKGSHSAQEILEKIEGPPTDLKDLKPIMAEKSKPVQAITVVKEDVATKNTDDSTNSKETEKQVFGNFLAKSSWLWDSIPNGWKDCLLPCRDKLLELSTTLSTKEFLPAKENIWRALELTPLDSIKVVILGQDPYPNKDHACGLAFSVLPTIKKLPASLKNIYKELLSDIDSFKSPLHGNLESWANQGVLLLNTVLTVEEGNTQLYGNKSLIK